MRVIASLGLAINLVSMRLLKAGSGESRNIKGAYLKVWADMLGSVGVLIGAILIELPGLSCFPAARRVITTYPVERQT